MGGRIRRDNDAPRPPKGMPTRLGTDSSGNEPPRPRTQNLEKTSETETPPMADPFDQTGTFADRDIGPLGDPRASAQDATIDRKRKRRPRQGKAG